MNFAALCRMSYVPPHLRIRAAAAAAAPPPPKRSAVRFIGNVTGNIDVSENTGVRFAPLPANALPKRHTIRRVRMLTPYAHPPAYPTTQLSKMPKKFHKAVSAHLKTQKASRRSLRRRKPKAKATRKKRKHAAKKH